MQTRRPKVPPFLALAFAILATSTASIFIRYAQAYAPSLVIAAGRLVIATLLLTPFALTRRRAELKSLALADLRLALLAGFFLALHFATWISSLEYTTVASSVLLVSTTPLWVALLAPVTIKEPVSRPVLVGMFLALAGGVIVGLSDVCVLTGAGLACPPLGEFVRGRAFLGDLLALTGALMAAGYLIIGRNLRARVSTLSYVFVVYGISAMVLVGFTLAARQSPFGYPSITYLWLLMIALVPQLIGHSTFNWALGFLSAAIVSIALLGEPVGSTVLAYFLLKETPSMVKIFGAILILVGIYVAAKSENAAHET